MTLSAFETVSGHIGTALNKHGLLLATAESCTGGGLSFHLTSIAGSSDWFDRGFVTYSNESKINMLGVKPETLQRFGAVSEETAREMAEGVLLNSNADVSVAITGIAGPDGGAKDKPVGTVWLAFAHNGKKTHTKLLNCPGNRQHVRETTIEIALNSLLELLENKS
jgi:nicotinamide-nucleotide amidase